MWAICHVLTERHIQVVTTMTRELSWAWLIRSHKFSGNKSTNVKLADPLFHLLVCTYTSCLSVVHIIMCIILYILYILHLDSVNPFVEMETMVPKISLKGYCITVTKKRAPRALRGQNQIALLEEMCRFTTSP